METVENCFIEEAAENEESCTQVFLMQGTAEEHHSKCQSEDQYVR
jgi:hypothetical protein